MDPEFAKPMLIRFGSFELDLETSQLKCAGVLSRLQLQPARVLGLFLASNPGALITREQIRQHIWGAKSTVWLPRGESFLVHIEG
jgi:DNA-binding response OmpR family regulator